MKNIKTFKRIIIFMLVIVMAFGTLAVSAATTYKKKGKTVRYTGADYKVYYNSKRVNTLKKPAVMINRNVMIPYRKTLISSGPKLISSYNKLEKTLTLTYKEKNVKLYVDKKKMYINGVKVKLNTAPFFMNFSGSNTLMIPAKAVLQEAFGLKYTYKSSTKSLYIVEPAPTTNSAPSAPVASDSTLTAASFVGMSNSQFIAAMGPIAQEDYKRTGVLASVTLAQAINESGWGKSGLAQSSNNMFGMKTSLSGNTWAGSSWDGISKVRMATTEEYSGKKVTIYADFRKYNTVAQSVADHSAYLLNAKNGSSNRYGGLTATDSYRQQLVILHDGGYCTWSGYVSELTALITQYHLTQYDK